MRRQIRVQPKGLAFVRAGYLRPALNRLHQEEGDQFAMRLQKNKMVTLNFYPRCTYQLRLQVARFEPYHKGQICHAVYRPVPCGFRGEGMGRHTKASMARR